MDNPGKRAQTTDGVEGIPVATHDTGLSHHGMNGRRLGNESL
jgi:hypothetical protein